jgi:hypothetical protein
VSGLASPVCAPLGLPPGCRAAAPALAGTLPAEGPTGHGTADPLA